MSLYDIPEPTTSEKQKTLQIELARQTTNTLLEIKESLERATNMVWRNENLTPQEIFDAYGTNGYLLFQSSANTIEFIMKEDPTFIPTLPPYEYTINEDGTVVIGDLKEGESIITNV